ncbi:putative folate-biopterin transporter 4 [Phytophthora citrophthora]|uniref:Folate-biopterin transporter 4 n=1 Tax=Phytophthora citrophthora TaxID=4793 RepID=A0AAD9GMG1_9STRA|nr:putative folate-biopterin transporter 4 [Phytophthora citrophthora]
MAQRESNLSTPRLAKNLQVDDGNDYLEQKSPNPMEKFEEGALREGPPADTRGKNYNGFLFQYVGAGLIYSVLYSIIYPFLNNYLRMSGIATASAYVLIALPWSLKTFFGIITDCYPIFGYRRRPYMVIGWAICTVCCFVLAVMPEGDPYYPDNAWASLSESELTADQIAEINYDAPNKGTSFILIMFIANLGMVLSFTACGGTLVELSQREGEKRRGDLQTMIWVARDAGGIVALAIVGFGLNSEEYGGTFAGSIRMGGLMGICAVTSFITGLVAWYCIEEERVERRSMRVEVRKLFDLIQYRVVYQVLAYQFFGNMFSYVSVTAATPLQSVWLTISPVNSSVASIISTIISMVSLLSVRQWGLNWNWRWMIVVSQLAVVFVDCFPTFLTIWDVVRTQWFWLGVPLLEQVPTNIGFIVSTYCMVEIMEEGNEAAFYGLVVAVSSLASPFATVITKNIDANFAISTADLQRDDTTVREQVTYAYLCSYACKIFSTVFVLLIPRQKAETQEMRRTGGKSKTVGIIVVIIVAFTYVWTIMTNVMSIYPSTSCLKVAGGDGC